MSQAALIINVSDQSQIHSNGLSGTWHVVGRKKDENFSLLTVYPTMEIQDIGDQRKATHWLKAMPLALDIIGARSDAAAHGVGVRGSKEKWGLLICEAEPDVPKSLLEAIEVEAEFLTLNRPEVRYKRDAVTKANVAINVYEPGIADSLIKLSERVQGERVEFENECRRLVQKSEVARAKMALRSEDQRLVAEADRMWARPQEQQNINELHRMSCARLGQERPWCYLAQQLVDCPGCGKAIKENILSCPYCGGWLEEGIKELRTLDGKTRARFMYPERYETQPVLTGAEKNKK